MPQASELEAALAKHRAELEAGERAASSLMVDSYGRAWRDARRELERVTGQLEAAIAAGEPISPAWLYQRDRLRKVTGKLEAGLRRWLPDAELAVVNLQGEAVTAAQRHASELVDLTGPEGLVADFVAMPEEALADLVGFASNGSPLRAVFSSLGPDAGDALERALVTGMAQGMNPRAIARKAEQAVGHQLTRALTIARTETLRAYRESSRRSLEANPGVVAGWTWWAALDGRTCAVCWAMHGREFPATETLDGHPNCRCAMVPLTHSWAHLAGADIPDTAVRELEPGAERFAQLDDATQRGILGPAKHDAYKRGELELGDVVARSSSPQWGTMRREASLRDAKAARTSLAGRDPDRLGPGRIERQELAPPAPRWSPDELGEARAAVADLRRAMRAEAHLEAEAAWEELGYLESPRPPAPPVSRLKSSIYGRQGRERGAGTWDWLEQVDEPELKRLRRWWDQGERGELDGWAKTWGDAHGMSSWDTQQVVDEWRRRVDRFDAAKALRTGKVPSPRAYPGLDVNELAPELHREGYDVRRLLAGEDEAAEHVLEVWSSRAGEEAQRELGAAGAFVEGPAPWTMTEWSYEAELMDLEGALAEYLPPARPPASMVARWHELIPGGPSMSVDELTGRPLSAEALWRVIQSLAQRAGYV